MAMIIFLKLALPSYLTASGGVPTILHDLLSACVSSYPSGKPFNTSFLCLLTPNQRYICNFACIAQPLGPEPFFPGNYKK